MHLAWSPCVCFACYKADKNYMYTLREKIRRFLLWSQKYTKADMLYIGKNGFWVLFNQSTSSVLSLLLMVAFANLLPKETYGTYSYILALASILNIFTLTGMNEAVARAVASGKAGVLRPAVVYQLKWNLLMLLASLLLGSYYLIQGDVVFATSLYILGLFVPATLAFNTYSSFLEGKKDFRLATIFSSISTCIYSAGMLFTLLFTDNIIWLIGAYAAATFVPSFIFYLYVTNTKNEPASNDIRDTLKFGRELTYIRALGPVINHVDKIVLGHFWGPAQLATYTLASAIPARANLFIKGWLSIGLPKFSEKDPAALHRMFWTRILQGLLTGTLITFLYILIAPYIFTYILPQYLEGVFYSQLLAINFIFALPNRYVSLLLTSQGLSSVILKRTITMSILSILLYILLGIWGGIFGLITANLTIAFVSVLINIYMWQRVMDTSIRH